MNRLQNVLGNSLANSGGRLLGARPALRGNFPSRSSQADLGGVSSSVRFFSNTSREAFLPASTSSSARNGGTTGIKFLALATVSGLLLVDKHLLRSDENAECKVGEPPSYAESDFEGASEAGFKLTAATVSPEHILKLHLGGVNGLVPKKYADSAIKGLSPACLQTYRGPKPNPALLHETNQYYKGITGIDLKRGFYPIPGLKQLPKFAADILSLRLSERNISTEELVVVAGNPSYISAAWAYKDLSIETYDQLEVNQVPVIKEAIERQLSKGKKVVFHYQSANPAGRQLSKVESDDLRSYLKALSDKGQLVMIVEDDAYVTMSFDSPTSSLVLAENFMDRLDPEKTVCFSGWSTSKGPNLGGVGLGQVAFNCDLGLYYNWININFSGLSLVDQYLTLAILAKLNANSGEHKAAIQGVMDRALSYAKVISASEIAIKVPNFPQKGPFILCDFSELISNFEKNHGFPLNPYEYLKDQGILTLPGSALNFEKGLANVDSLRDMSSYLRVTFCAYPDEKEALAALNRFLSCFSEEPLSHYAQAKKQGRDPFPELRKRA